MQRQKEKCNPLLDADAVLYDRYATSIFAYVRLQAASWEDSEDITLEVFTIALEHGNLVWLTERQQLAWLRRVAHNKLIDRYRRVLRPLAVPLEQVAESVFQHEALTPEQAVLRREELEQLYAAMAKLSLLSQQVLCLRFVNGLHFAEIAILLNKREEALRKVCSRSLAALRAIYTQQEGGKLC